MAEKELPAGAAIVVIDDRSLEAILNLPDGIHIHHTYVPSSQWGAALALVLVTNTPGILPPVERNKETRQIDIEATTFVHEGKTYHCVSKLLWSEDKYTWQP